MGDIFKYSANEWKKITNGVNKALISIGVDPTDSNTVYIGTHPNGLFKSTNGGNSWESISQLADLPVRDIGFHNGNIYLVTDCSGSSDTPACGVYVSKDSGNTWENIVLESLKSTTVFGISFHGNDLYIATANDAYKHTIGSESWVPLNVPFKETATIAATDNKIYVGTHGGGVYRSNINNIEYWKSQGPYAEIYNIQIKVDPTNSDTIYASSYPGGVFKSTDKGKTWNEKNFALPSFKVIDPTIQGYYSLEIDPNNPEVLYLGIFGKGVYKSTNGAGTWSLLRGENGKNMDIMK